MGCWGITAFESDAGLDAVGFIRKILPEDGKLELDTVIESLRQGGWNAPANVRDAESHTSPMVLAEIIVNFMNGNAGGMDYDDAWAANDKKFSAVTSFTTSGESIQWLRDYLSDTLECARENAEFKAEHGTNWNGWFEEKDWNGWQKHMETLVDRLDTLLASGESKMELLSPQISQLWERLQLKEGGRMNFLEQELKKMFGDGRIVANPRFVGLACYGKVTDDIRVKLEFVTRMTAGQYEAIKATMLNRNEGIIDSMKLQFVDLFGRKQVSNPNFRDGIVPYIWTYDGGEKTGWYVYKPTNADYQKITQAVDEYLDVFREPVQSQQMMGQKMC